MVFAARFAAVLLAGVSLTALAKAPATLAAPAAAAAAQNYDLAPQDLSEALREIAAISGRKFVAASRLIDGKRSAPVTGRLSADQAYAAALSGTGLQLTTVGEMFVVVEQPAELPAAPAKAASPQTMSEITVTGTRIRGQAPVGANLIVLDRNDIDQSGYATAAQLLSALPQNFNGGPTESTAGFSTRNNANLNQAFGSSVNLRGLGADSTLVLLNGQRPAMAGLGGAFADISMIPSSVIKRVEVLADGASALYGSDAVAGVVTSASPPSRPSPTTCSRSPA
jgi:iron complex outermembrane recepter protein